MKVPAKTIVAVCMAVLPPLGGVCLAAAPRPATVSSASSRTNRDAPAVLLSLSDDELARRVELDVTSLGSLSIGSPGGAILLNPVAMPPGPHWVIAPTAESWGTAETITAIETAVDKVFEVFPDSPRIAIGDISASDGGRLKRHASHQGGRDVDLGFYARGGASPCFFAGTAANMDLPRNWTLIRALVTETDVEAIFLDTRVQRILYKYALSISEDKDWLDRVFRFSRGYKDAIISHERGHRNHYHVRFYNPIAQELGRRAHPFLVQSGIVEPPVYTVRHVVRAGQTMGHLAARYGTSVGAIQRANGLTTTRLRAGRAYRIPVRAAAPPSVPLVVPPRLLPPTTPAVMASVAWPTSWLATVATPATAPISPATLDPGSLVRLFLVH
jgi:penicillin-insensitive murein endopeptidase